MSIRLWLMVADCWVCGASIELTEEQEQAALRLLEERKAAPAPVAQPVAARTPRPAPVEVPVARPAPRKSPKPAAPQTRRRVTPRPKPPIAKPEKKRRSWFARREPSVPRTGIPAAYKPNRVRQHLSEVHTLGEVRVWFRDVFRDLPAWLVSGVVNLLLLLLLSLWLIQPFEEHPRELILSTNISVLDKPGDFAGGQEPEPMEFETTGAEKPTEAVIPDTPPPVTAFEKPPIDPGELIGDLPKIEPPPDRGTGGSGSGTHILQGRDPSSRSQRALEEGGTIASEAAVTRGLIWLAKHQNPDGSWSLHGFTSAGDCAGQCADAGGRSDNAGTALALLPFLGAGQTHLDGQYRDQVKAGLEWLVRYQGSDGDLRGRGIGNMYAHGQCTIALCEAYAMTRDPWLREPAQKAVDFIVAAQHSAGGWRYQPGQPGDTSVVGWQLMALRSAQMAYLEVPDDAFTKANRFLDSVQQDRYGGLYAYQSGNKASEAMTAEALLCRQYSGWPQDHQGLIGGCDELLDKALPRRRSFNIYYVYYGTQVMHHMQGKYFDTWNSAVRDMLVDMQETRGHEAGSWTPVLGDHIDRSGGRLYWTSLALCSLEVYYRHLPLYGRSATGD